MPDKINKRVIDRDKMMLHSVTADDIIPNFEKVERLKDTLDHLKHQDQRLETR